MLTIEEIKKALDSGKEVELECIDQEAYWKNTFRPNHYNSFLLSGRIVVRGIDKFGVDIIGSKIAINSKDLKYFSIKRHTPTFNDLVDVATQALKDGLLSKLEIIEGNSIGGTVKKGLSNVLHFHTEIATDIQSRIDFIKPLYTETFTIEHASDIVKIKLGDLITLENGNEVWAESNCLNHNVNFIQATYGGNNFNLSYLSLKGATVTKKRGSA